jgi:deazaflavin-dependent oxidoreductase (nitroreductase family)
MPDHEGSDAMTPPRAAWLVLWGLHKALRRVSGGRIGTRAPSDDRVGTLFLHTVGWKSGEPRTNGLYYLDDGPDVIVVASNAGADWEPAWWVNLRAQPYAEIEMAGKRRPVRAREATAEEAARLWPRLDAANPDFVAYRARVSRHIPIVILEPR